ALLALLAAATGSSSAATKSGAAPRKDLWVSRYNGPGNSFDTARAVVVGANGSKLFVTGWSYGSGATVDYATVAYDASTGAQLWVRRYDGAAMLDDAASALAVSPSDSKVFVTGQSTGPNGSFDYATVAYDAATERQLWVRRYDGPG